MWSHSQRGDDVICNDSRAAYKQNLLKMAFERGENLLPNSISEF